MKINLLLLKVFVWIVIFNPFSVYSQNMNLTSLSPVRNGQNVSEVTDITYNFSVPINGTTVNTTNFSVNSLLTGKKSATLSGNGTNTIVINPTLNFKPGEIVNASVTTSVQGTGGETMANNHSYLFRVAAGVGPGIFVPNNYVTVSNSEYLTSADFNGDGYLDFATATASSLTVFLNNGSGTFTGLTPIAVGQQLNNICSGDFDGDGDVDIIVSDDFVSNLTSYLYVKYNNGSGIFSSGTSILTAGHPISMTASDFNGDGKTDVAVCHRDVSNIYIIKHQNGVMNLSGGGYASYQSIQYYPTSFCAADFDNDGDIDLGAATSQGKFLILSNTPSGFLGIGMFTPSGFGTSPSYQIISSADFDNDGNMDLVASSYSDMYILKNNGAGSLTQVASFNLGTGFPEKGVTTADAEGDGDIDVIVANGQSVFVIKNNGSNNFSLTTVCTLPVRANGIAVGDIDGDADMDILTANSYSNVAVIKNCLLPGTAGVITGSASVIRGQSAVSYSTPSINNASSYIWSYTGEGATIINNSNNITIDFSSTATNGVLTVKGYNDCGEGTVSANFPITLNYPYITSLIPSNGTTSVISSSNLTVNFSETMNSGTASSSAIAIYGSLTGRKVGTYSGGNSSAITFDPSFDFLPGEIIYTSVNYNAKNASNVSIGKTFSSISTIKSAIAPGAFGPKTPFSSVGSNPRAICTADFNGDLKPDLAWANYNSGSISVSFNNGSGSFSGTTSVTTGTNPNALAALDFDGDSDMDLAVVNQGSNTVSILINNSGIFSLNSTVAVGSSPRELSVSDFDGDGDFDIVVVNYNSNNISLIENNAGVFSVRTTIAAGTNPIAVASLDFDNDGDADIAVANYNSNNVMIFKYQGPWNYIQSQALTISTPTGVYGNDLDGDGDIDLAISSFGANAIYIRKNDGAAFFSGGAYVYVGNSPYNVKGGDFDGDGDIDLSVANYYSNSISVSKNNGAGSFGNNVDVTVGTNPYSFCIADFDSDGDLDAIAANYGSSNITPVFNCDIPLKGTISGTQNINQGQSYTYTVSGTGTAISYIWEYTGTGASFSSNPSSTNSVIITFSGTATPGSIRVMGTNACGDGLYSNYYPLTFPLPTVVSVSPSGQSFNVDANTNIAVTFSEAMSNGTAGSNAIKINRSFTGVKSSAFSGATTSVITADPSVGFKPGEKVQTSITSASQNLTNLYLKAPYVFNFTTATGAGPCQFNYSNVAIGNGAKYSTLADFNGDGYIDVATLGSNVVISTNNGKGVFSNLPAISVDPNPTNICSGDFDGDGDVDFATTSFDSPGGLSRLSVKYNNGIGGISSSQSIQCYPNPICMTSSDFDGDGRMDVAVGLYNSYQLNIFKNNGTGLVFSGAPGINYQGSNYMPTALSSTDFDKDGDIDIVSVNGSGLVLILSNDGTGLFSPVAALQINLVSSVDYKALDVEDFDGDGRPDIALGVSNKAVIIKNNSNNTLSILYEANISSSPYTSPVAADIDGDGDIDVALTTGSSVTLIKNNGAGNFTTSTIGSTGSGARGISAADLDGDNDMDIVSTNTTGNNLTVFFNNLPPTISTIANQSICINATKNVNFTVNDAQTPLQDLVLTANSLNIALIPVANLTITGSGSNRTLSIVPVAGQTGTSDITLTVTDHNNAAVSVTFTITVNPLPTVIASASPSSICSGSSTNLSVTGAISYLWSPATTLDNSTIANPIATLPTPGNYSYQVVGTDANGCSNSTSVNVTVNQVSVNIGASPSATICPGTNVIFTATPTNGGITPSYQWKVGSTSVGTNSSTYSTSGLINGEIVTCILTSSDVTCITGNPATSNALPITVNALPPTPIMTVSPTTICQDGIVNVSCTSPPSPYTSTYTRPAGSTIMGGGGGPGGFGESVKVTQTGNFVFTYINPTTSCTNSTIQTVTVNPCSVSLGTVTPLNLCAGGAIQIPYTSMGTSSSTVYVVLLVYSSGPNVTLGTMTGVPSIGTFNLTIPANTPVGKNYRVKIVTSYPSLSSPNNADDITISRDCGAYGFNGTDSRILIPSNTAYNFGTGNFTLEAWVKMDATSSGNSPIISKRIIGSTSGSFMLSANAGTQLLLQINGVDVLSSSFTSIYDNTCHHVAVSRSGSTISFYLDGILKGTSSNAGSISSTNSLKIGHDSFDNTNLKGNVDEVRIWDIARTASEILNNKSTVIAANTYGLKGYWQMNESAGQTVYDATLTVNNGTLGTDAANADAQDPTRLSQGACYVPALQSGLTFDGTLDRVTIPHHSSYDIGSGDFTIEAWVRLQSGSNGKPILSKRTTYSDGFLLMPYTSGTQLLLQLNGVPNYLSSTFPSILDNICHHIAVTRSGSTITFYVDGVAYGTVSSTRSLNSTGPLYIGYDIKDNSTINGQINEVQIWNQALSASSIQSGMTTEVYPGGASALKGYWKLKEPSGQTVVDLSTTANSGYLGTNSLQFDAQDPIRSAFSCYSADRMGYGLSDVADFVADSSMIGAFSGVKIYPNPFMKETNIVITGTEKGEGELSILDLSGRLMWGDSFLINEVKTINLPLPAGVYIVRIKRNDKTEIYRIMKTE